MSTPSPPADVASLLSAFPVALEREATAALAVIPPAVYRPAGGFEATVCGERVIVPQRIYNPEPDLARVAASPTCSD